MNSKRKGKDGELELCAVLRDHGVEARRAQQFKGTADSEDITHSIRGVHLECKRTNRWDVYTWLAKAEADGGLGKIPLIAKRQNREKEWVGILYLTDVLVLLKKAGYLPANRLTDLLQSGQSKASTVAHKK